MKSKKKSLAEVASLDVAVRPWVYGIVGCVAVGLLWQGCLDHTVLSLVRVWARDKLNMCCCCLSSPWLVEGVTGDDGAGCEAELVEGNGGDGTGEVDGRG